jgi:hypothetical protein
MKEKGISGTSVLEFGLIIANFGKFLPLEGHLLFAPDIFNTALSSFKLIPHGCDRF